MTEIVKAFYFTIFSRCGFFPKTDLATSKCHVSGETHPPADSDTHAAAREVQRIRDYVGKHNHAAKAVCCAK